jgi:RimJ/RimL family protein N-acetyltransferase
VEKQHLEQLRFWRNSVHVKQFMLTQDEITQEQQLAWFAHICRAQNQKHYVIEYRQKLIGSCNLKVRGNSVDIKDAKHFEIGLYIGEPKYLANIIAFAPTLVLNDYCFSTLSAELLHAVVKPENQAALRYNQTLGYQKASQTGLIELTLNELDYQKSSQTIKRLLDRPAKKIED